MSESTAKLGIPNFTDQQSKSWQGLVGHWSQDQRFIASEDLQNFYTEWKKSQPGLTTKEKIEADFEQIKKEFNS